MQIVQTLITNNPCYKRKTPITVKGLMLHSIGCSQPSAEGLIANENKSTAQVAVHGFIDATSGIVYQTLPWAIKAWHCGVDATNSTYVGVEMCEPAYIKYTGGASFKVLDRDKAIAQTMTAYNSAVELFATLCHQFKLDPLKDGVILSHAEGHARGIASNHGDPDHLWKGLGMSITMDKFRSDVSERLEDMEMTQEKFNEMMETYLKEKNARDVSTWAKATWTAATKTGLVDGTKPQGFVTREQVVQIVANAEAKK